MSLRWLGFLLIASTFAIGASAAENGGRETLLGTCETRLTIANIIGVVKASLRNGGMDIEAVKALAASESPVNPLAHLTPTSISAPARRALMALTADPLAQAMWPQTREALHEILRQHAETDKTREDGSRATRRLLIPTSVGKYVTGGDYDSAVALPDGTVVAAHFLGDKVAVTRVSDGQVLHSWTATPHSERMQRRLAWNRDKQGKLWLYTASAKDEKVYFQRLDLENPGQDPVLKGEDVHGFISDFDVYGDFVVATVQSATERMRYFNLSGVQLENVTEVLNNPAQNFTALPSEVTLTDRASITRSSYVYVTRDGRKFSLTLDDESGTIHVLDRGDPGGNERRFLMPAGDKMRATKVEMFEARNGRILIAVRRQFNSDGQFVFYALDGGEKPIYLHRTENSWIGVTRWFEGPEDEPLYLYTTGTGMGSIAYAVDPESGSVPLKDFKLTYGSIGITSFGGRTFLTVTYNEIDTPHTEVFDMFSDVEKELRPK